MPKYLVRRRNKWGQYVHLATWNVEPSYEELKRRFGPGDYCILIAEENVVGLSKLKDVSIQWEIEYVGWVNGIPTIDYIRENYGNGNYYVLTGCNSIPYQVFPVGEPHDMAWQHLQDGASAMKGISIIFRIEMPWV